MKPQEQQDRIDAYLDGRLSDADAFEREINTDPQLKSEMEATRMALDAITFSEDQRLKERLRGLEAGFSAQKATPGVNSAKVVSIQRRQRSRWPAYAAAAALLLFLGGYFFLRPSTADPSVYAMEAFEPYPNIAYSRTKGASDEDARAAAYLAYDQKEYAVAETEFRALGDSDPVNAFYLGQSLLAQQEYEEAAKIFTGLQGRDDFRLADEAGYYLALAQLGSGDLDTAREKLQAIAATNDHPNYAEAVELLEEL